MTKPASDPSTGPAPTPRPRTPALVRGAAVIALGLAGCGGGEPVPPQAVPPQAPPNDVNIAPPPQAVPPQAVPPPPQVAPPPPNQPSSKNPASAPPNQR